MLEPHSQRHAGNRLEAIGGTGEVDGRIQLHLHRPRTLEILIIHILDLGDLHGIADLPVTLKDGSVKEFTIGDFMIVE